MPEVAEEKKWAVGLTQHQFEQEFMRQRPWADTIPDVNEWLGTSTEQYHGIDGVNAEDYEVEGIVAKPEKPKEVLYCKGCKKEFDFPKGAALAKSAHERRCKALLNTRI